MPPTIEGYWYSDYEPQYPIPIPFILSIEEANEIANLITEKVRLARKNNKIINYRGSSISRITGERLGSEEVEFPEYKWPLDFGEHYVRTYKVKPTDGFLKWLGWTANNFG